MDTKPASVRSVNKKLSPLHKALERKGKGTKKIRNKIDSHRSDVEGINLR